MPEMATEETKTLTIPEDAESLPAFIDEEVMPLVRADKRGAKTLLRSLERYMRINSYAHKHLERAQKNLNTVNGVRTARQQGGDKARSLRHTAEKFYGTVADTDDANYSATRLHCKLFNIDFDSYNSTDDVVDALVEHHTNMAHSV